MSAPSATNGAADEQSLPAFLEWALETLELDVRPQPDGSCRIEVDPEHPERQAGLPTHSYQPTGAGAVALDSPLLAWVRTQLSRRGAAVFAVPKEQPVSVHEITQRLFAPYQVRQGRMRLAGCQMEDRPILRFTLAAANGAPSASLRHWYFDQDGRQLSGQQQQQLRLHELVPAGGQHLRLAESELVRWIASCRHRLADQSQQPWVITVIWCKYVHGKLAAVIGERSAEIPFEGWARTIRDGTTPAPPYKCPETGKASFQIAATDDGRITVLESLARCEISGREVLESDLKTCAVTGKQALAEFLMRCPVSNQYVLTTASTICSSCQQQVGQQTVVQNVCTACRQLRRVHKDDPRMARILDEYPKLDRWRHWKLAETTAVYILQGLGFWNRMLAVLDKETLEVRHAAQGHRLARRWSELPEADLHSIFGSDSENGLS